MRKLQNRTLEHRLGDWMRARLPHAVTEFIMFGLKQAWACLFGGLLLAGIIISKRIWQPDWPIDRYDGLFLYALILQILFLLFKLESLREARVILLFHLIGTAMEIFKISAGSWAYAGARNAEFVSFAKMGSWYLLLYVSFGTVTLIYREALEPRKS